MSLCMPGEVCGIEMWRDGVDVDDVDDEDDGVDIRVF
jgi:hypothetical protein